MERLTIKKDDGRYYINQLSIDNSYSAGVNCFYGKPVDKLAEFEDFMEANDLQELEQLQEIIERDKFNYLITAPLEQENQTLKGNWAKLREYAEQLKGTSLHMTAHHEVQKDDKKFGEFVGRFENAKEVLIKMQELESADGEL